MKNIKLLLATTAMLSTALAMNVKAETISSYGNSSSADINVDITIVGNLSIVKTKDLSFGIISPKYTVSNDPENTQIAGTITVSPKGVVTATDLTYFQGALAAEGYINQPWNLPGTNSDAQMSTSVGLPPTLALKSGNTICGNVTSFAVEYGQYGDFNIGATFEYTPGALTRNSSNMTWNDVKCTGTLTATLIINQN